MSDHVSNSFFAPSGRVSEQALLHEKNIVARSEMITTLLNAMPDFLLVLNEKRQIVAVNQRLLTAFGVENPDVMLGLRPGEAVGCIHSKDGADGCGTAKNCSVCGAVIAILSSQDTGLPQQRECQLMLGDNCHALDLDVLATPVTLEEESFTVLALRDISSEKRRYVMERVFFHDILNSAGGIRGLASLLNDGASPETESEYKAWMVNLADNLIEEINHQRRLLLAERGDYKPVLEPVDLSELLHDVKRLYENHDRTPGRKIEIEGMPPCILVTDRSLLRRIIGNMVLNGLEASKPGDTVSIWIHCQANRVRISVTNPGEMSLEVQLHLFKRSFSTKEKDGRGLGTYSMKLFGEGYLGGVVDFRSNNGMTTFFIELQLEPEIGRKIAES
jgi:signal transduction histidine kinase